VKARPSLLLPILLLAGCGERAANRPGAEGSTTPPYVRETSDPSLLNQLETPVRVGELGPSFAACNGRGAARDRAGAVSLAVRAAPYAQAAEIDRLSAGADFYICARSQDESWLGIVYDAGGHAAARCGVDSPAPARHAYLGPCAAGWVASAEVRFVSGTDTGRPAPR
jgi:hypothetical protein